MTTPPHRPAGESPAPRFDDPTRDIRLPSLPDRPATSVRPEWQTHVRRDEADTSSAQAPPAEASPDAASPAVTTPDDGRRPEAAPPVAGGAPPEAVVPKFPPGHDRLANQPTDKMSAPPRGRQQTLAFDAPASGSPGPATPGAHFPGSPAGAPLPAVVSSGPPPFRPPGGSPPFGPSGPGAPSYGPPGHGTGRAPAGKRRWPWVVLTILPILVIIVSGLLLLWLLRGA